MMAFSWIFLTLLHGGPIFTPQLLGEPVFMSHFYLEAQFSLDFKLFGRSETSALSWVHRRLRSLFPAFVLWAGSWGPVGLSSGHKWCHTIHCLWYYFIDLLGISHDEKSQQVRDRSAYHDGILKVGIWCLSTQKSTKKRKKERGVLKA